jgi:hypothetical protein
MHSLDPALKIPSGIVLVCRRLEKRTAGTNPRARTHDPSRNESVNAKELASSDQLDGS